MMPRNPPSKRLSASRRLRSRAHSAPGAAGRGAGRAGAKGRASSGRERRSRKKGVLVLGFGNPARGDDGLGPRLCEAVAGWNLPGVTVECDYQLGIEDAFDLSRHHAVVFADAAASGPAPYCFRPLRPARSLSFSSHASSPAEVLLLCRRLFHAAPRAAVLSIRGYDFAHFRERLSTRAQTNLGRALRFLRQHLQSTLKNANAADPAGRIRGKNHG